MKTGGALRGMARASRVSGDYVVRYLAVGSVPTLLVGLVMAANKGGGIEMLPSLLMLHFFVSSVVLLPTSLLAGFAFARLLPRRTWRRERWRSWSAGGLGVLLTWGGMAYIALFRDRPPRFLRELLGGFWGELAYNLGWFVLLSNLALLIAWLLPSRRAAPVASSAGLRASHRTGDQSP